MRSQNEDRGRSVRPGDAVTLASKGVLVLVADGMGGHQAGDVASTTAADVVSSRYYASSRTPQLALEEAFVEANAQIHAAASEGRDGMGTTCTALVLCGGEVVWAHVGDSRLYRSRRGRIERLTTDHSVVAELVAEGVLTEDEARHHDQRNVITRALGIAATTEVTLGGPQPIEDGDVFVLMSDGLYDLVTDLEIATTLGRGSAWDAASALVEQAKDRGGHDNVTVAVVRVVPPALAPARPTAPAPPLS
ncbi:protein phosphatase 2C domain-containing protein [Rubrivirga sp.]|uniref:protein phosphatase 2C domain-containing protein n=1 Tax=Rubrivirga sp. TaxID=1885344 RepID=UPI003C774C17